MCSFGHSWVYNFQWFSEGTLLSCFNLINFGLKTLLIKEFLQKFLVRLLIWITGAHIAQWVKSCPTDLVDRVRFQLRAKSSQPWMEFPCTQPFIINLQLSRYDWNTIEKDVKSHVIYPSIHTYLNPSQDNTIPYIEEGNFSASPRSPLYVRHTVWKIPVHFAALMFMIQKVPIYCCVDQTIVRVCNNLHHNQAFLTTWPLYSPQQWTS